MKLDDLDYDERKNTTGICEHCESETGEWRVNPFDEEFDSIENWEYICSYCYTSLCVDI